MVGARASCVIRMESINVKGCLIRREFSEPIQPFQCNPSQSIAIRRNPSNPSQSIQYIIVIHPSQSIAIHPSQSTRNPSQSTRNPSQSTRNQSQSTRNPSQRQAHRLNAQHGSNAQHTELTQSWVRTCRRALEWGWGMRRDVEDGEVVMLTASEKLRRRQGLRRGEQRVSDAVAGLSLASRLRRTTGTVHR